MVEYAIYSMPMLLVIFFGLEVTMSADILLIPEV